MPKPDFTRLPAGVVVVTGASGQLGPAVVEHLALGGAQAVLLVCRKNTDAAWEVAELARESTGAGVGVCEADLATDEGIEAVVLAALALAPTVAGLVHLAGVNRRAGLEDLSRELLDEALAVDLVAGPLLVKALAPHMHAESAIVLCGSRAARAPLPGISAYAAAKQGVAGLVRSLAAELGPKGIRINAVAPGLIRSGEDNEIAHLLPMVPLGRAGKPVELAGLVRFLLSSEASYLTGQTIALDGGM